MITTEMCARLTSSGGDDIVITTAPHGSALFPHQDPWPSREIAIAPRGADGFLVVFVILLIGCSLGVYKSFCWALVACERDFVWEMARGCQRARPAGSVVLCEVRIGSLARQRFCRLKRGAWLARNSKDLLLLRVYKT